MTPVPNGWAAVDRAVPWICAVGVSRQTSPRMRLGRRSALTAPPSGKVAETCDSADAKTPTFVVVMLFIWGHLLSWEPDRPSRAAGITAFRRREEGRSPPSKLATDLFEDGVSRRPGVLRQRDRRLWT